MLCIGDVLLYARQPCSNGDCEKININARPERARDVIRRCPPKIAKVSADPSGTRARDRNVRPAMYVSVCIRIV